MTSPSTFIAGSPRDTAIREPDHRNNDGIDVRLLWNSKSNCLWVRVEDERSGEALMFGVAATDALEAFHHRYPYAYAYAYASNERTKRRAAGQAPSRRGESRWLQRRHTMS